MIESDTIDIELLVLLREYTPNILQIIDYF